MALLEDRPLATAEDPARPHRFTWDEVLMMAENNLFGDTRRAELIGGEVYVMPEEGFLHVDAVRMLQRWILPWAFQRGYETCVREPVHFDDATVLIPDLSVFPSGTSAREMKVERALLIIEVADTTEVRDRAVKFPRYAQAGVQEAWLVQARERAILAHRAPMKGEWTSLHRHITGQTLAPLCAPDRAFALDDLPASAD